MMLWTSTLILTGIAWAHQPDEKTDPKHPKNMTPLHMETDSIHISSKMVGREAGEGGDSVRLTFEGLPENRIKVSLAVPGHKFKSWSIRPLKGGRVFMETDEKFYDDVITLNCKSLHYEITGIKEQMKRRP